MRLLCHEFGGGHLMRLKKSNFETLYCFLRQLIPEVPRDTIVTLKMRHIMRRPGTPLTNMDGMHDIMRGLILCIPFTRTKRDLK